MPKSPEEIEASMVQNMAEKTGKSMDEWLKIAGRLGAVKHGEIVKALKAEHGMTHGYANLVAHYHFKNTTGAGAGSDDLVGAQYAGPKAELRPIYESIIKEIQKFGSDVEVSPKKTYVSLRRNKQFALIQPTTKTRLDIGINLKGLDPKGRLEASGSFNAMVSHRVRVESAKEVDGELIAWLKSAYDNA